MMKDNAGLSKGIKNFIHFMASCGFMFIFNSSLYVHSIKSSSLETKYECETLEKILVVDTIPEATIITTLLPGMSSE